MVSFEFVSHLLQVHNQTNVQMQDFRQFNVTKKFAIDVWCIHKRVTFLTLYLFSILQRSNLASHSGQEISGQEISGQEISGQEISGHLSFGALPVFTATNSKRIVRHYSLVLNIWVAGKRARLLGAKKTLTNRRTNDIISFKTRKAETLPCPLLYII